MTRLKMKVGKSLRTAALVMLATGVFFVILEGASSTLLSLYGFLLRPQPAPTERVHTEYDELLGWINIPNLFVRDMYGEGIYLRTNSQRFRNDTDFTPAVPEGKRRLICSGNSYTLGWGVSNAQTWCAVLGQLAPNLETVNMGQGGYGVDQAYLWYSRDGTALEHDLHVFALITPDIARMRSDNFLGYGKPVLRIRNGELEVDNIPVPQRALRFPWFSRRRHAINRFRTVELARAVLRRIDVAGTPSAEPVLSDDEVRAVLAKLLEDLKRTNDEKNSVLAVLYLPRSGDLEERTSDPWRAVLYDESERSGFIFIDLVREFRKLSLGAGEKMFQRMYFPSHYNAEGNEWVARQLLETFLGSPEIAAKLARQD